MLLSNFKLHECIAKETVNHFAQRAINFTEARTLLLSKKNSAEVQAQVNHLLAQAQIREFKKIKKKLAQEFFRKQLHEDELAESTEQKMREHAHKLLQRITDELSRIEAEINPYVKQPNLTVSLIPKRMIVSSLPLFAGQDTPKTQYLREKKRLLHHKMQELNLKLEHYEFSKKKREARQEARISYKYSLRGVETTLDKMNNALLQINSVLGNKRLTKKLNELQTQAEQLYYPILLQVVEQNWSFIKLKAHESHALRRMLRLMKEHLQHDERLRLIKEQLRVQKTLISQLVIQLHQLQKNSEEEPSRQTENTLKYQQLVANFKAYQEHFAKDNKVKNQLTLSSLFCLGLTCIWLIPTILTLSAILTFSSPWLVYGLIYGPLLLLLVTTLATGLASLAFSFKAHNELNLINENKQQIEAHLKELSNEQLNHNELRTHTIPTLEARIKKEEEWRCELEQAQEQTELLLKKTLEKAEKITPLTVNTQTLFPLPADTERSPSEDFASRITP